MEFPKIIIAAMRGGAGKTILTLGIIGAWCAKGYQVAPFKKGPDYIDAGWLALAAGRPCYNLDSFLIPEESLKHSFCRHTPDNHIAVIEGNRGLFDGSDEWGTTSTAELSKILKIPIILCVDCTKSTRTVAAAVLGCMQFDPEVRIQGVILNRVAGLRHETVIRRSIDHYCGVPLMGAVPKLSRQRFPERHMGLVPTPEHAWATDSIQIVSAVVADYLDLEQLLKIARQGLDPSATPTDTDQIPECNHPATPSLPTRNISVNSNLSEPKTCIDSSLSAAVRIGVARDAAFQFYYEENLEALQEEGAELVFISPLVDPHIPLIDALYIGGGFPETHAGALEANSAFRDHLKSLAENNFPIYAECGGLMYLGDSLVLDQKRYTMAGILPIVFGLSKRPQAHGYTVITVEGENPFFEIGTELKGHEFHYSNVIEWKGAFSDLVFHMQRGSGFIGQKEGVAYKKILATYTHIHALGTPQWAQAMVRNAREHRNKRFAAIEGI